LCAGDATEWFKPSTIDARLNVEVEKGTDVVHFIRTNNDPNVLTKTYVLKHADPYELRGYLREIVQTRRVNESDTGIQAIKYSDGTGIIMIYAEDYRFDDAGNGQSIDAIIKMLDKPKVVSVTGQPMYVYQPKFRSAAELRTMVRNAGADVADDVTENIGGSDRIRCDEALNLMFFKTTNFSRATIEKVLKAYDIPTAEVRAKITVYELYAENDTKLGFDFQAWKNNDGIDLFSTGGRFMKNFSSDGSALVKDGGWSDTTYFQFSPKWNTKYLDFLTSKGKAKIVHTGEMAIRSGTTAEMNRTTQVFVPSVEPAENGEFTEEVLKVEDVVMDEDCFLSAVDMHGKTIGVEADGAVSLTVLKLGKGDQERYTLRIEGGSFVIDGNSVGPKAIAKFAEVSDADGNAYEFESNNVVAPKGNIVNTAASGEFGFYLSMTPSVSEKATILDVTVNNSSLIGYTSDGTPRIQPGAEVSSSFMISNKGTKLVIGGLEKRDVVSVSGGIPLLKDLPLIGWIFSTESESTKRSQLVVVAEVIPVNAATSMTADAAEKAQKVDEKLGHAGEKNTYGYRQFLIDSER
ncbi:MAG: hypothetical protein J6Q65_07420, partial [Lentisphaeria bacterium]|nr:hypothetical protein [Lentisphaeria bacterium]